MKYARLDQNNFVMAIEELSDDPKNLFTPEVAGMFHLCEDLVEIGQPYYGGKFLSKCPSQYHEFIDGQWVLSDKNKQIKNHEEKLLAYPTWYEFCDLVGQGKLEEFDSKCRDIYKKFS